MTNPLHEKISAKDPELAEKLKDVLDEMDRTNETCSAEERSAPFFKKTARVAILWALRAWFVLTVVGILCALVVGAFRGCGAFLGPLPPD